MVYPRQFHDMIDMVYDTVLMQKDDSTLYVMWTARTEGNYYRFYCPFDLEAKTLGEIGVNRFRVGDTVNDLSASGIRAALAENGVPCKKMYSDIGIIFKNIFNLEEVRSLDKMCDDLEISQPEILHTAEADAYTTMRILKEMCKREKVNPDEFFKKYPSCFEKYDFTKKTKKELKKLKKTAE